MSEATVDGATVGGAKVDGAKVTRAARLSVRQLPARCLGVALAVAAADPVNRHSVGPNVALAVVAAGFAWWAAPSVDRAKHPGGRLHQQLARHRNTVLAVVAVLLTAVGPQRPWAAVAVTALLLSYLLHADTYDQLHRPPGRATVAGAYAAAALVLLAAVAPTASSQAARLLAVLGVAACAAAVGLTLYERRGDEEA
ncbi:hypothetical protein [Kitasatospora sp. NBC_01266]|uniref:hypothetical protein n=1 Tax=Kitasatospora sp. NBC_01266 TaxID=2903572 RepID=UPI002E309C7F|nr:hypothetical protein [Kitasatospora sp. NBC_01266]